MDILIRGIDPVATKKYDELAKRQGVSRNKYLSNLINNFAALEEFKSYQRQYETVIDQCLKVIQQNSSTEEKVLRHLESEEQ
jgi:hypothetical protein